ncbi:MAG TPA: hypothetical protein VF882_01085 [Gemmatimonadales bacterium]
MAKTKTKTAKGATAWLPLPQACRLLGIDWMSGYRLVLRGSLRARWNGRRWQVARDSVEAMRRKGPPAAQRAATT